MSSTVNQTTIAQLFAKDITRPINGVVKADQTDANAVWQELDEYVVTKELAAHFRKFFDAYLRSVDNPKDTEITGAMGVWISGYFGSGKSHFLKILSYLLKNESVEQGGINKSAFAFFDGKFQDTLLFSDIRRAVNVTAGHADVLLFNIESKANTNDGRAALLNVFLRVFNECAGYSGDYPHIAAIERQLEEEGKLAEFHAAFERGCGARWYDQRHLYGFFLDEVATALSQVLGQSVASCRQMVEAESRIVTSPENFAKWVREYLDRKGPQHRIFFLVDEIGQFIGEDTHLMLSLQTITENLSTVCGGRAWVIVTSQENIDAVLGEVRATKANDFSKIQGRFVTRLSLSSSNTDEVIQKRLLEKTPDAQTLLSETFAQKGDVLRTQTRFQDVGETYPLLDSSRVFVDTYPFLPYQFNLIQRVFEQVRRHGAIGVHLSRGERSMLDAFRNAAVAVSGQVANVLVPLHRFYPSIESLLDTQIKRTVDQAGGRVSEFEGQLLRTLFLIRYVDKFKGNLENLTTLCLDEIDADRIALRGRIEAALLRLENETLIGRNGEEWFFLTNEERDVSREIKEENLSQGEETRKLSDLLYEGVLKGQTKHRYSVNKKDFGFNRYLDGIPFKAELEASEIKINVISPLNDDLEPYNVARCVLESSQDHSLILKLDADDNLRKEVQTFLRTDKYVKRRSDTGLPEMTQRILRERAEENRVRERRLGEMVKVAVENAENFADGQVKTPTATGAEMRLAELLEDLIRNSFPKLGLLSQLKTNPQAEVGPTLRAPDVAQLALSLDQTSANPQAITEVRDHIGRLHRNNQTIILDELTKRFEKRPYGWPEWETTLIVARLLRVGEITLVFEGKITAPEDALDIFNQQRRWKFAVLQQRKTLDSAALRQARDLGNQLFAQMGPDNEGELATFLRRHLESRERKLNEWHALAANRQYPGASESQAALALLTPLLRKTESTAFIEEMLQRADELRDVEEDYADLAQFHGSQRGAWDKMRAALSEFAPNETDLNNEPTAANALRQLREIAAHAQPYGQIRHLDGLIATVRGTNEALIATAQERARATVQSAIVQVEGELDAAHVAPGERGPYLEPLRALELQIGSARAVGNIFLAQSRGESAKDAALKRLEIDLAANSALQTLSANGTGTAAPALKPRHVVTPKNLVAQTYLESESEVRAFLSALEAELLGAIQRQERIEIR